MPLTRWRNSFQIPLVLSVAAHNASVLILHFIHQVWLQLCPMLAKPNRWLLACMTIVNDASALARLYKFVANLQR